MYGRLYFPIHIPSEFMIKTDFGKWPMDVLYSQSCAGNIRVDLGPIYLIVRHLYTTLFRFIPPLTLV